MWIFLEHKGHLKELSFCHKLRLFHSNILATLCRRPYIFQTVNSNNISLKYWRFRTSSFKNVRIKNVYDVEKTQFLTWKVEQSYSNWINGIHELLCWLVYLLPESLRAISQRAEAPHHHYTRIQTSVPPPGTSFHCSEHVPGNKQKLFRKIKKF